MTEYQYIIQSIVTDQAYGNAIALNLARSSAARDRLPLPTEAHDFDDDNCLCLEKDGAPAWATEVTVRETEYLAACALRDGPNPPVIRCADRSIQYTLREWAASLGYSMREAGQ